MNYSEKLKDYRWQEKRLVILERDGGCCRNCGEVENLQIHHTIYFKNTEPWDYDNDFLLTLCRTCHWNLEEQVDKIKLLTALIQKEKPSDIENLRVIIQRFLYGRDNQDYFHNIYQKENI